MIVTITAYKRPALLHDCLQSIARAQTATPDVLLGVIVSLDHHSPEMTEIMSDAVECSGLTDVTILTQSSRLGVANHPRWLFNVLVNHPHFQKLALVLQRHERFVALEEDTIVAPDCFQFADWALGQEEYQFVNLADHKLGLPQLQRFHSHAREDWELRSPYGWAFTSDFWRVLEPQWNGKIRAPYGWDWQLSHLCYRESWRSLTPEVARVYNTGREDGTYDTPENWDRTQRNVRLCDIVPDPSEYEIVRAGERPSPPDWVREEMRP